MTLMSCSKEVALEADDVSEESATLVVRTRSGATNADDSRVSYPVYIYVFGESGTCVASTTVESEDEPVDIELREGLYDVCAVAGITPDCYDIPARENASGGSVVRLKSGKTHGDVMYAQSSVLLESGEENTLTFSLRREVMLLQEVTISNVPSEITDVSIVIAPLYGDLCLNGLHDGATASQMVALTRQEGSNVWKSTSEIYMFEALDGATVKVQMTGPDGTKSYSYSLDGELQANYKIKIEGTYTGVSGVVLTGILEGVMWAGERVITFSFDDEGNTSGTGGTTGGDNNTVTGDVPEVGTIYKGCYVVSSEPQSDSSVRVTLMSVGHKFGLSFDQDDQASIKSAVDMAVGELAVDEISGWRLPVLDEIQFIVANYSDINKVIAGVSTDEISPYLSYFYQTPSGLISSYCEQDTPELNRGTRLRAVATLTFR